MLTQPISTLIRFATPLLAFMLLVGACTDHAAEEVMLSKAEFEEALSDAQAGGQAIILSEERTDRIMRGDEGALEKLSSIEVVLELEPGVFARWGHTCSVSCPGECTASGCTATTSGCTKDSKCSGEECGAPTCSKTSTPQL